MQVYASAPQLVSRMSPFNAQLATSNPSIRFSVVQYESVDIVSREKERIPQPSAQIDCTLARIGADYAGTPHAAACVDGPCMGKTKRHTSRYKEGCTAACRQR